MFLVKIMELVHFINNTEYMIEDGNYDSDKLIQSINTSIMK